ncbi:hypothetical protein MBLNU230_g3289t1 [Neophaeotheca triangularis]
MALQTELPPYLSVTQLLAFFLHTIVDNALDLGSSPECEPRRLARLALPSTTSLDGLEKPTNQSTDIRPEVHYLNLKAAMVAVSAAAWLWILTCSAEPSLLSRQPPLSPTLDHTYSPTNDLDIVISMYRESPASVQSMLATLLQIPSIASTNPNIIIYLKDPSANPTAIQTLTNATLVHPLPNLGREGETYLHHITTRWDQLAAHTLFLQAGAHNAIAMQKRAANYFDPERTGFLSLARSDTTCECDDCSDRWDWQDDRSSFPAIYRRVFARECQAGQRVALAYKGQFIASAPRIRGVGRAVFEALRRELLDPDAIGGGARRFGGGLLRVDAGATVDDALDRPVFGYTVERLWGVLMQCPGLHVAAVCPSLLSGWRRGGGVGDCQCLDR